MAEIDEEIAQLVRELWRAGIDTSSSCQENWGGRVWVEFPAEKDLLKLLNIVAEQSDRVDDLYARILQILPSASSAQLWEFEIEPADRNASAEMATQGSGCRGASGDFALYYHILLPRSDLAAVVERLERHNGQLNPV